MNYKCRITRPSTGLFLGYNGESFYLTLNTNKITKYDILSIGKYQFRVIRGVSQVGMKEYKYEVKSLITSISHFIPDNLFSIGREVEVLTGKLLNPNVITKEIIPSYQKKKAVESKPEVILRQKLPSFSRNLSFEEYEELKQKLIAAKEWKQFTF